jgi:hypothetical protein
VVAVVVGGGHEFVDGFGVGLPGDVDGVVVGVVVDEQLVEDGLVE